MLSKYRVLSRGANQVIGSLSNTNKRIGSISSLRYITSTGGGDMDLTPSTAGTTPDHTSYLVLQCSTPPGHWPSHPPMSSKFLRDLTLFMKQRKGLVNLSSDSSRDSAGSFAPPAQQDFLAERPVDAMLYLSSGSARFLKDISEASYEKQIDEALGSHTEGVPETSLGRTLYVCTHGSRDCRCGVYGTEVLRKLQSLSQDVSANDLASAQLQVRDIAHVGGHIYAANVLDMPNGDWYGSISKENASELFRALLLLSGPLHAEPTGTSETCLTVAHRQFLWKHWRGKIGLSREAQVEIYNKHGRPLISDSHVPESAAVPLTPKVRLSFATHEGSRLEVEAHTGQSLMEAAKASDLPSVEGVCGGKLECATCHVYLPTKQDSQASAIDLPHSIPPITETEEDMLEYALFRNNSSRLSCQIPVTQELADWCAAGGIINLPRY